VTGRLVRAERSGPIDVLVLDSQHNRNALSVRLLEELLEHVGRSAAGEARALVLDHDGPVFCSGVDLRERQELGTAAQTHSELLGRLLQDLWAYPKPVLCRVAGAVRGGGMGLVACSDILVASAAASFAYSEVRVGVAPAIVASVALAKTPLGLLLPWLLTGEPFGADVARDMGLISRVTTDAPSLEPETSAIVKSGPKAVQAIKRLARDLSAADVRQRLEEMTALSAQLFAEPEALEGMAAFSARRPPAWATPAGSTP
jgi:enoyl-CoA hydratase/carnithine racemase